MSFAANEDLSDFKSYLLEIAREQRAGPVAAGT